MNPGFPTGVLFVSSLLWGLSWWPMKQLAAQGLDGIALIAVAYGSIGLLALPVLWRQRRQWRSQAWPLLLIMIIGGTANFSFATALTVGEVIRVMALFYLLPVWGVLGGRLFLGERLTAARLLSVVLALGGAFLLLGGTALLAAPPSVIDLVAILSGFAFAMNNLAFRAFDMLPVASKVGAMFCGCGVFALAGLGLGFQDFPGVSAGTLAGGVLFGVGGLLVATSATQWAVTRLEAGRSSIIMVMELVGAVVSAAVIAGERLEGWEWVGAGLILMGAVVEGAGFSPIRRDALRAPQN